MFDFKIIAVDFDGTLCVNKWPEIGKPNMDLINYLKDRRADGNRVILWTCRVGSKLMEAIYFCASHGLYFDAVNENLPEVIKEFSIESRKIFAHEYIDDRAASVEYELPFTGSDIADAIHKGLIDGLNADVNLSISKSIREKVINDFNIGGR